MLPVSSQAPLPTRLLTAYNIALEQCGSAVHHTSDSPTPTDTHGFSEACWCLCALWSQLRWVISTYGRPCCHRLQQRTSSRCPLSVATRPPWFDSLHPLRRAGPDRCCCVLYACTLRRCTKSEGYVQVPQDIWLSRGRFESGGGGKCDANPVQSECTAHSAVGCYCDELDSACGCAAEDQEAEVGIVSNELYDRE
jgi:hypothetical protein